MTDPFPTPRRTLVAFFLCLLLLLSQAPQRADGEDRPSGFSQEKLKGIPALLKQAVDKKQIAGGAALVAQRGKIVQLAAAGMQDVEGNVPLTDTTIFRIASMTKPITSVAIMAL